MNIKWLGSAVLCTTLLYCGGGSGDGGGSGVDSNKTIASLSDSELEDVCTYFANLEEMPEREIDCGDGTTITDGINPEDVPDQIEQCIATAPEDPCPLTVGEAEACFEALADFTDDDICALADGELDLPSVCAPVFDPACE